VAFEIAEGWHIYWTNPGDAGLPTEVEWTTSAGSIGTNAIPAPERFPGAGGVTSFGFEGRTAIFAPTDAPDEATIAARIDWLACQESCIKGGTNLSDTFGALPIEAHASARARVPEPLPDAVLRRWDDARTLTITLQNPVVEFFPLETDPAFLDAAKPSGSTLTLEYRRSGTATPSPQLGVVETEGPDGPKLFQVTAAWPS
jgi:hypothetical protein